MLRGNFLHIFLYNWYIFYFVNCQIEITFCNLYFYVKNISNIYAPVNASLYTYNIFVIYFVRQTGIYCILPVFYIIYLCNSLYHKKWLLQNSHFPILQVSIKFLKIVNQLYSILTLIIFLSTGHKPSHPIFHCQAL